MAQISIDFSVEELVALGEVLGLAPLPGLDPEPLGAVDEPARGLVLDAARRSLAARRVLAFGQVDGTGPVVVPAVATLLSVAAAPGLCARVACQFPDESRLVTYTAQPDITVEHVRAGWLHRLAPLATADLVVRMLEVAGLEMVGLGVGDPDAGATAAGFSVPADALRRAGELVLASRPGDATAVLVEAGAPAGQAAGFVAALGAARASVTVTVLHRPGDRHLAGGELAWLDGGDHGLWLVPVADGTPGTGQPPVVVETTTVGHIARLLLGYVPSSTSGGGGP